MTSRPDTEMLSDLVKEFKSVAENGQYTLECSSKSDDDLNKLTSYMKLAGFVDVKQVDGKLVGSKPQYSVGAKVSLAGRRLEEKPTAKSFLKPLGADGRDQEEDLVDENEILSDEVIKAAGAEAGNGCGPTGKPGGRKPCADCSCGRKEEYEGAGSSERPSAPPADKSACGNCNLGDAFRCSGCPYLGLPPFKPGEKISLSAGLITSDL